MERAALASAVVSLVAGCSFGGGAFTCSDDNQCGVGGVCEPAMFCSFADATCTSGRRYGDGSGSLSGVCVGEEPPDAPPGTIDARIVDAPPGAPDAPGVPDAPPGTCPAGYAALGGSSTQYRVIATGTSWQNASNDCNNDDDAGGFVGHTHLVVLSNEAERLLLQAQVSGNKWIGLEDPGDNSQFIWVSVENTMGYPPMSFPPASPGDAPWQAAQPVSGDGDQCVRLRNAFDLDDRACGDNNTYICECDAFAAQ